MIEPELLKVLACPRCKGDLQQRGEGTLWCAVCSVNYPVRGGIPILMSEEARASFAEEPAVPTGGQKVKFIIVEGKNKGEVLELEKGTCRAVGRSLDETEKTRVFSLDSAVTLDDASKKLVMNFISRQFQRGESIPSPTEDSLGTFRRRGDICLRDSAVSRLHAMFFYGESGVGILDLVSKNGTYVNGVEVESRPLKKGDVIMIGATKLRWE